MISRSSAGAAFSISASLLLSRLFSRRMLADGRLVAEDEGHGRVAHLHGERVLGLPGRGHARVGVVHRLALRRHAADDLEAHRAHDRDEEGDEHEGGQELEMDGGPQARDRAHEAAQGRVREEEAGARGRSARELPPERSRPGRPGIRLRDEALRTMQRAC